MVASTATLTISEVIEETIKIYFTLFATIMLLLFVVKVACPRGSTVVVVLKRRSAAVFKLTWQ